MGNPYEILGLDPGADDASVKAKYRELAKQHHPDLNGGDDAEFKRIVWAFDLLSDPGRRDLFDRLGVTDAPLQQVDHVLAAALELMREITDAVVKDAQSDPKHVDLRENVLAFLEKQKPPLGEALVVARAQLETALEVESRMEFKGEGEDFVGGVIRSTITHVRLIISGLEFERAAQERLAGILAGYAYRTDPEEPKAPDFLQYNLGDQEFVMEVG